MQPPGGRSATMSKGSVLTFYGIGGSLFSDGMADLAEYAESQGWEARVLRNYGPDALKFALSGDGPVVVAGHSQGTSDINNFAEDFKAPIAGALYVDSWFPFDAAKNVKRAISVRATQGGRFHVTGSNVVSSVDLPETHTTVDNAAELQAIWKKLLDDLSSKSYNVVKAETTNVTKPFYIGEGRQISEDEIAQIAGEHGIPAYLALAATSVESADLQGSWSSGALVALYEDHVAWRNTEGATRQRLAEAKLAAPNWRDLPYPKSPYPAIDKCAEIAGAEVAAKATSWGLYQILGENAVALGYKSAVDMVETFAASERAQVEGWLRFLDANNLKRPLMDGDFKTYARGYNGPKFAENRYDTKLAERAAHYASKLGTGIVRVDKSSTDVVPSGGAVPADLGSLSDDQLFEILQRVGELQEAALAELKSRTAAHSVRLEATPIVQTTKEGFEMSKISKLLGGLAGLFVGNLVAKGVLPPEAGEIVNKVTVGGLTPDLIISIITTGLGIYFAPKNKD